MKPTLRARWNAHHEAKAIAYLERARRGGIWAVYRLFNRYYLKSFFGPFFAFAFPILLFGILGSFQDPMVIFPGIAASSAMAMGLISMPFAMIDLKKSVLLKRIGASPVKPWTFTVVVISYLTFIVLLSTFWLMLIALLIHRDPSMFAAFKNAKNFFSFFYGTILNTVLALMIGFAVATVSKSTLRAQALGLLIYFPSAFLSGQFLSIEIIARTEGLNIISRIFPFRYTTMYMIESWVGDVGFNGAVIFESNPFAIHEYGRLTTVTTPFDLNTTTPEEVGKWISGLPDQKVPFGDIFNQKYAPAVTYTTGIFYDRPDHIVAYISPFVFIAATGAFSLKRFQWSA